MRLRPDIATFHSDAWRLRASSAERRDGCSNRLGQRRLQDAWPATGLLGVVCRSSDRGLPIELPPPPPPPFRSACDGWGACWIPGNGCNAHVNGCPRAQPMPSPTPHDSLQGQPLGATARFVLVHACWVGSACALGAAFAGRGGPRVAALRGRLGAPASKTTPLPFMPRCVCVGGGGGCISCHANETLTVRSATNNLHHAEVGPKCGERHPRLVRHPGKRCKQPPGLVLVCRKQSCRGARWQ